MHTEWEKAVFDSIGNTLGCTKTAGGLKSESVPKSTETARPSLDRTSSHGAEPKPDSQPIKQPLFVPKFKGVAEMDGWRRVKLRIG